MSSGLLGVATSGLLAFQRSMTTTSHNIANVNTEGYSRQSVDLETRRPQSTGAGFIGRGVNVAAIDRAYDSFLTTELRSSSSSHAELESYFQFASKVDNFVANENTGLTSGLQAFFNSTQEVADDPTSIPARQAMLSEANNLAYRFNSLGERLESLQGEVNHTTEATITEVNSLAGSIAEMNERIVIATGASGGNPPNDLLDKRDLMITQLSEMVDVTTVEQQDGAVNLFIGKGQILVIGNTAAELATTPSITSPGQLDTTISIGTAPSINITGSLSGGVLGGVKRFQDEILAPAISSLDDIATKFAADFNAQHSGGWDLNGVAGTNTFFTITPATDAAKNIKVAITDPVGIAASAIDPLVTADAIGNNENMLSLAQLQFDNTMLGGTASFHEAYGRIVGDIGSKTHAAEINEAAQAGLLQHARTAVDSLSGVNLDEEAANLLKFQQAYQATAQVISISKSLFDTLINSFR
jgi:flagellar hook-associated protein 1 FlgK